MLPVPYGEEMYCTAPTGFAIKNIFLLSSFLPFSLCPKATTTCAPSTCCSRERERERKKKLIANEPLWVFRGCSFLWSSHESSFIDFSDQTNALWSFLSTPTSVLMPPTSAGSACASSMEGHVCLFPSNWKSVSKYTTALFASLLWCRLLAELPDLPLWILIWTSRG